MAMAMPQPAPRSMARSLTSSPMTATCSGATPRWRVDALGEDFQDVDADAGAGLLHGLKALEEDAFAERVSEHGLDGGHALAGRDDADAQGVVEVVEGDVLGEADA